MKGSLPLILSMCHGFGLDKSSLTEPCESPRTASPNNFCPKLWNCRTSFILDVNSSVSISDVMATTSNMEDGYENEAQLYGWWFINGWAGCRCWWWRWIWCWLRGRWSVGTWMVELVAGTWLVGLSLGETTKERKKNV